MKRLSRYQRACLRHFRDKLADGAYIDIGLRNDDPYPYPAVIVQGVIASPIPLWVVRWLRDRGEIVLDARQYYVQGEGEAAPPAPKVVQEEMF